MTPPLVGGGQGRDPRDLIEGAGAVAWAIAAGVVLVVVLLVFG